jgi:hypothetical protein
MYTSRLVALVAIAIILATAVSTEGARITVALTADDVQAYAGVSESVGGYYVTKLPIPAVLTQTELYGAYLEFYVDVDAIPKGAIVNEAPNFDVCGLNEEFSNSLDAADLGPSAWGPVNIARGSDRRVVVDITRIVRYYLENPSRNHGLILGAVTGDRDGLFDIKATGVEETLLTVNYHYGPMRR